MLYIAIDNMCKAFQQDIERLIEKRLPTKPTDNGICNLFYEKQLETAISEHPRR